MTEEIKKDELEKQFSELKKETKEVEEENLSGYQNNEDIEVLLIKKDSKQFVEYKKNVSKYESVGAVIENFTENEKNKAPQREKLQEKLIVILELQIIFFTVIFLLVLCYLFNEKKTDAMIDVFKWFMIGTLGEITAIVFFIVKFLFNNNEGIFKHIKEILRPEEKKETEY